MVTHALCIVMCCVESCQVGYLACDSRCINPVYRCDGVIDCTDSYLDEITDCPGMTSRVEKTLLPYMVRHIDVHGCVCDVALFTLAYRVPIRPVPMRSRRVYQ